MNGSLENVMHSPLFTSIPKKEDFLKKPQIIRDRKNLDINLFQGYDIRGDALEQKPGSRVNLRPADAYLIGMGIGSDFLEKATIKKAAIYRPKVFVSADNRLSSPSLREALMEGFYDSGCRVDYTEEEVPTGAVSRKILISDYDISVQITGSHNPFYNNGFKVTSKQNDKGFHDPDGIPSALYGNKRKRPFELIHVYDRIISEHGLKIAPGGQKKRLRGIVDEYIDDFIAYYKKKLKANKGRFKKNFSVVMDPGNGVGGCAKRLMEALGINTIAVFSDSDGSFPNHPADPSKIDGVKYTCEFVRSLNQKNRSPFIGIVYDGDGDRSGIIDEDGCVIYPEKIVVINYIRLILENQKALQYLNKIGEHVDLALDVRGPSFTEEILHKFAQKKKLGLSTEYIPGGYPSHRNFARKQILKINRVLAEKKPGKTEKALLENLKKTYTSAETSGHFFYATAPDHYPDILIDDGIFSAVNLMHIIDTLNEFEAREPLLKLKKKKTYLAKDLFQIFKWKPVSHEIRDRAPYEDKEKFATIENFKKIAYNIKNGKKTNPFTKKIKQIIDIDGVRIVFEDNSFLLMRGSNTSPNYTYKFEGPTQGRLVAVIREFIDYLNTLPLTEIGKSELKKELAFQKKALTAKEKTITRSHDIFSFENFETFISDTGYRSFLKSKTFADHVKLVDKNEAADRFGYRSEKSGIFSETAFQERKKIEKWINHRKREGFRGMIHFGIGGQALGNRAQIESMGHIKDFKIKVIEKIGTNMTDVFNEFKRDHIPADRILLHASSKSGTTDETLIGFQDALHALCTELSMHFEYGAVFGEEVFDAIRTYFKNINSKTDGIVFSKTKLKDLHLDIKGIDLLIELLKRLIFTTTLNKKQSRFFAFAESPLVKELMKDEPLAVFSIPNNVGGRFSELSQSGAVTIYFSGRSIQKQFQAGKKIIPILESHDPEQNPALKLAVYNHMLEPEVIIFGYPSFYMKAEAQQKAQLFPESNGKYGKGAFVITAVGSHELNQKIKAQLKLNPQKPPLVILQNTASLDSSVKPVLIKKELAQKVPCLIFTRHNLSEENLAASALFFQEFTVRCGILRTAAHFAKKKQSVSKLNFSKKNSAEMKTYSETDPQNQPFVELAKKSVSERASSMFKDETTAISEIKNYYQGVKRLISSGPYVEKTIISGRQASDLASLISSETQDKIEKASQKDFSEMENEVLIGAIENLLQLHPSEWLGRSVARDKADAEALQKTKTIMEDISVLGHTPLSGHMEIQAKNLAYTILAAESQGKIPLPILYTPSVYAEVLGMFYVFLSSYDYGIGTREQHSFFQSILDGLDKTFTLLFDFSSDHELIEQRERQIFTFGLAKDYLHNLYPDIVRRLFLEEEANAIASVKRSAAIIRLKGLDDKESICEAFRFIARGVYLKNAAH